ncbi:MAG: type IX secretion system outer membrane channel protein PorV [Bacteroidetes bacterium]|nr:MAG: type IX secretion system outer membrane channel protein PorV [Bacteroidota bacterium]
MSIRKRAVVLLSFFLSVAGGFSPFLPIGIGTGKIFAQANKLTDKELLAQLGQLNTITTAVPFLLIGPDSRAGGLGDAGVATSPDPNSMHWNPSKYAFVKKQTGISLSYTPWLRALVPDINLAYLSGYYKMKKNGTVAASLRYFSLGNITFTDIVGNTIGQFRPNEFAFDVGYGTKLGDHFSGGGAIRYIHSDLTGKISVEGSQTHAGNSVAADICGFYQGDEIEISGKKSILRFGANISNIGAKIAYSDRGEKDFIPINMKLGSSLHMQLDEYNEVQFTLDINKLLVPTPPLYETDGSGNPAKDPNTGEYIIKSGKDPDRSIVSGMVGSFSDAPGGFREEIREFNLGGGFEYWYAKQFAIRAGYFNEPSTKGGRKFITLGLGLKYTVFGLDFAYLIPTEQRHPLQNTLRFSLLFDFDAFKDGTTDEKK